MKKMVLFFISILAVILTACFSQQKIPKNMREKYLAYQAISQEINKKYGLNGGMIGSTNNVVEKKVEGLCFYFSKKGKYTKDEARKISVETLLECMLGINKSKNLEKYFLPYPSTHKNVELIMSFRDELDISHETDPLIGNVFFQSEKFQFNVYEFLLSFDTASITHESFEEAYHKVKQQLPMHLQSVAEESLKLSEERKKTEVEPIDYPNDDSHPGRIAYRKWIERTKQPRDAKGYLIPTKPTE